MNESEDTEHGPRDSKIENIRWRERKLRCKFGIHSASEGSKFPFHCKLCGRLVQFDI